MGTETRTAEGMKEMERAIEIARILLVLQVTNEEETAIQVFTEMKDRREEIVHLTLAQGPRDITDSMSISHKLGKVSRLEN